MSKPAWAELRPSYTNIHAVHAGAEIVRVVLGEGFGPDPQSHVYHTAVVMGRADARLLAESILKSLSIHDAPTGRSN